MFNLEHRRTIHLKRVSMPRILLVDHNPQIRSMTKKLIETREDWLVTEAIDSYDAIVQVAKLKPDILVLDFAMPGLNGFQIAEKVSAHAPNLPIILYTFYGFNAMNIEAKKHGISEVVDKADVGDRLLDMIEKHVKLRAGPSPDVSAAAVPEVADKEEPPQVA